LSVIGVFLFRVFRVFRGTGPEAYEMSARKNGETISEKE
jgi:hypothetical protein